MAKKTVKKKTVKKKTSRTSAKASGRTSKKSTSTKTAKKSTSTRTSKKSTSTRTSKKSTSTKTSKKSTSTKTAKKSRSTKPSKKSTSTKTAKKKSTRTQRKNSSVRRSGNNRKLGKKQLDDFRGMLVAKRVILQGDVDAMEFQALKGSASGDSGEMSQMPLHLADLGSDNYEQDFTLGLIESEEEEMRQIDEALERIEEGSFGICEECEKPIPLERLKALPHSRNCIHCQEIFEQEQESGEY